MNKDEFWLAFASIEQIGSMFVKRLYEHFGCIKSAWCAGADDLYKIEPLTKKQIDYFLQERKKTNPQECLDSVNEKGISYITFDSPNYPSLLKEISNPPMTLFYKGDLQRCNFNRTLAIVGSRKASENSKVTLGKIISEFRGTDICIVSGLAAGIDTAAHKNAIKNNLSTIGVIASGFDYVYPKNNKELYRTIEEQSGVIFSEYWHSFEPLPWRFPHRNRIVSGLSYGTLVAEAAIKSGAIITANLCLEQNRELMCMPGMVSNPNTEGVYKLLKNGAAIVTSARDILETLNWTIKIDKKENSIERLNLSEQEIAILQMIAKDDCNADNISSSLNIPISDLMVKLTMLELGGYIKQSSGDSYTSLIK